MLHRLHIAQKIAGQLAIRKGASRPVLDRTTGLPHGHRGVIRRAAAARLVKRCAECVCIAALFASPLFADYLNR